MALARLASGVTDQKQPLKLRILGTTDVHISLIPCDHQQDKPV